MPLKILIIGRKTPRWTPDNWLKEAFEILGHKAKIFDVRALMDEKSPLAVEEQLLTSAQIGAFHIILITRGNLLSPYCIKTLGEYGHTHFRYIDARADSVRKVANLCHTVSASSTGLAEELDGLYIPDGCLPSLHKPGIFRKNFACNISIIGNPYENRFRIYTSLKRAGFSVRAFGNSSWPKSEHREKVHFEAFREVVASSEINLATNLYHTIKGWTSIRVHLLQACGGFVLINHFPGIEKMFTNQEHLVWYHDEEEIPELARYWLDNKEERQKIAERGRQHVYTNYTITQTAQNIIEQVYGTRCATSPDDRKLPGNKKS